MEHIKFFNTSFYIIKNVFKMKIGKYEIFALLAITLLASSILLMSKNIPTRAADSQPIYLHGPALNFIHMHSNITLTPIHMYFTGPPEANLSYEPVCTNWHELHPNYCQMWHLTGWEDNGDGLLSPSDQINMTNIDTEEIQHFHVDRITYTLNLSNQINPTLRKFIEFKGLPEAENPIENPICTFWHEVYPNYCNVYHIINWTDDGDGILDFCDLIDLQNVNTSVTCTWHVDGVSTDIILRWKMAEPIGTWWHELHPNYSKWYNLTSWEDNGDGYPGPCDQIDMTEKESETKIWYHLDRVTITINVTTTTEPTQWMMLELKTEELEEMFYFLQYPLYSLWHEVYPNYSNIYNLTMWDPMGMDNCNGVLDPCDYIMLLNMTSGEEELYHIVDMTYDIILNKKITNPVSTTWHELYPEYCNTYHIDSWKDNGDGLLSPSDQINMTLQPAGLEIEEYHVENVTLTLNLSALVIPSDGMFLLIEAQVLFEELYWPKVYPEEFIWHEVWPNFCTNYSIIEWEDNCNGVLDPCDNITLLDMGEEEITFWHVEEVAIDMVVKKKLIHDVAVIAVSSLYPQVEQGQIDPINVTVENQGDYTENVTVYAFYNETPAAPNQTITLHPGQNITLTFNWNTTGVPLGNYTISANATIPIDDEPEDNVFINGIQEVIPEFPSAIALPLLMTLSLIVVAFKQKERKR